MPYKDIKYCQDLRINVMMLTIFGYKQTYYLQNATIEPSTRRSVSCF